MNAHLKINKQMHLPLYVTLCLERVFNLFRLTYDS
jgi:hypothetical protein